MAEESEVDLHCATYKGHVVMIMSPRVAHLIHSILGDVSVPGSRPKSPAGIITAIWEELMPILWAEDGDGWDIVKLISVGDGSYIEIAEEKDRWFEKEEWPLSKDLR